MQTSILLIVAGIYILFLASLICPFVVCMVSALTSPIVVVAAAAAVVVDVVVVVAAVVVVVVAAAVVVVVAAAAVVVDVVVAAAAAAAAAAVEGPRHSPRIVCSMVLFPQPFPSTL